MTALTINKADIADARRHLKGVAPAEIEAFAMRQLRARRRVGLLLDYYGKHTCRLSQVHLLTASSIAVARFGGHCAAFDAIGEAFLPVDGTGQPRSAAWARYSDICARKLPAAVRDEAWLEAHASDWVSLQTSALDQAFYREADAHPNDPVWKLMRRHLAVVFGSRSMVGIGGGDAPETAIGRAIGRAMRRLSTEGLPLVAHYMRAAGSAWMSGSSERRPGIPSYPRLAWIVLRSSATAWSAWTVYRRGLRLQNRGMFAQESDWPLLQTLMGEEVHHVHPLIVKFYENPGRFRATASLDLATLPLMFYSRLGALLLGQGLYEQDRRVIDVRLRVFRREDGSMHWVRELYCGDALRVFDSDFVIRPMQGKPTLVEVFGDLGIDVVLDVVRNPDGGVSILGRDIYWRGMRVPRSGLLVDFTSRVIPDENGKDHIEVTGSLSFKPETPLGRFFIHKVLRRPSYLGSIRYRIWPAESESVEKANLSAGDVV